MPRVIGKVLKSGRKDEKLLCLVQMNGKAPKQGELVRVKWGSIRTLPQNALYWKFLDWLISDAGLKDMGHFSSDALHENLKNHLLPKGKRSSSLMDKSEFSEFFDNVDKFVTEFFEIDTSAFWQIYGERHANA